MLWEEEEEEAAAWGRHLGTRQEPPQLCPQPGSLQVRTIKSPELDRTHEDPRSPASGPAQDNAANPTPCLRALPKFSWSSGRRRATAIPWGARECSQRCTQIQEPGKLPGTGSSSTLHCFFPCAKSCQQTSHPDPVATLPVWSLEKPIKHPAAPPPAPNLSISPPAGSWHGNAGNLSGLVSFEEYWQFGGLIQPNPQSRVLTQWSLKSPTTTAGAKDLAGFMEQPV